MDLNEPSATRPDFCAKIDRHCRMFYRDFTAFNRAKSALEEALPTLEECKEVASPLEMENLDCYDPAHSEVIERARDVFDRISAALDVYIEACSERPVLLALIKTSKPTSLKRQALRYRRRADWLGSHKRDHSGLRDIATEMNSKPDGTLLVLWEFVDSSFRNSACPVRPVTHTNKALRRVVLALKKLICEIAASVRTDDTRTVKRFLKMHVDRSREAHNRLCIEMYRMNLRVESMEEICQEQ